jgi:predicted MFS family arabinose efflux permease
MLDLSVFRSSQFTGANIVTFVLYGALGGAFFLIVVALQAGMGYSPTAAGASLVPVTIVMLVFAPRAGALAQRIGPRLPMTLGPIAAGIGLLLLRLLDPGDGFLNGVLPPMVVFGGGLALTVAPLTAAALSAVAPEHAGIASAVNNTVARVAGLLAVAVLPLVIGLKGSDFEQAGPMMSALHDAVTVTGALCVVAGVISWITIRNDQPVNARFAEERHCALDSPPLRPESHCTGEAKAA